MTALVLLAQALLVGMSTKWSERVNSGAVSAELIGMLALTVLLLVVGFIRGDMNVGNLWSKGAVAAEGYWSFGGWTSAGPWMLGFLLGAFTDRRIRVRRQPRRGDQRPRTGRAALDGPGRTGLGHPGLRVPDRRHPGCRRPGHSAASGTPIADVIKHTLGSVIATLLLVMVVVAIFACGLVIMMTGVRLTWAMSRDERFPGWSQWNQISDRFHTPLKATVMFFVLAELILAAFSRSQNALFTLFGAATLLPAVIYAGTVVLYLIKRKQLPDNGKFDLGGWEKPVLIVAVVWLVFELALFRDASFKNAWLYVLVMVVIGAIYLGVLLARRGRHGLAMPDMHLHRRHLGSRRRAGRAMTYVLAIDQGTSGTKAIVVDEAGQVFPSPKSLCARSTYPAAGSSRTPRRSTPPSWTPARRALDEAGVTVSAVALANQGETVLAWDRRTGRPLTPAIVWQDRRAEPICAALAGSADSVAARTGLVLDPYFSAPKMAWIRENLTRDGVVTTTDTWLIHRLCGAFVTDVSTASRSLLLDLDTPRWSPALVELFGLAGRNCHRSSAATTSPVRPSFGHRRFQSPG